MTTVTGGQLLYIAAGQTVSDLTVLSKGHVIVQSGGQTTGTVISSGGSEYLVSGGEANSTIVFGGGFFSIDPGATAAQTQLLLGAVANVDGATTDTLIENGGSEYLYGGAASGSVVEKGGAEYVYNGGKAIDTQVAGKLVLSSGSLTSGTVLDSGGSEYVGPGCTASGTVVHGGGLQNVQGTAIGTTIEAGGLQIISDLSNELRFFAISSIVLSGGVQLVSYGGVASKSVVSSGGLEYVASGGDLNNGATIAGGTLVFEQGAASDTGPILFEGIGGTWSIGSIATPSNVISGFVPGDKIDFPNVPFDVGATIQHDPSSITVNEKNYGIGLNIDPSQDFAGVTFQLSPDGRGGTYITTRAAMGNYSISPGRATVDENAGKLVFTITRTNNLQAETVYVSTIQDQGSYNAASGTTSTNFYYDGLANVPFTFAAGQASLDVPLTLHDRGLTLGSEKFTLAVQAATGTLLSSTTFTIVNTDTPASSTYGITPGPATVSESAAKLLLTVTRTDSDQAVTVFATTVADQGSSNAASGTASTNYYYDDLASASVTFAVGQKTATVSLTLHDRGLTSGSETFSLDLTGQAGALVASTTFRILNTDLSHPPVQPSPSDLAPTLTGPRSPLASTANTWLVDFGSDFHATDADGSVVRYKFVQTAGNGFFTVDGLRSGTSVEIPASQLRRIGFNVGTSADTDTVQVVAVDDKNGTSAPLTVSFAVSPTGALSQAPTPATLVDLSVDTYRADPSGADGYLPVPFDTDGDRIDDVDTFRGVAYASADYSRVVIAFRGTSNLDNLIADGSWVNDSANAILKNYFERAVYLLEDVQTLYPGAKIVVTGHSLGGSLAQLVGKAAGLSAAVFDAPGASDFYQPLLDTLSHDDATTANALAAERGRNGDPTSLNFRVYGDPISTVGKSLGTTITLANPSADIADLPPLDNHDAGLVALQVHGFEAGTVSQVADNADEPNMWGSSLLPVQFLNGAIGLLHNWLVTTSKLNWIDPAGNADFVYTQDANSPSISMVELPALPGVALYRLRYEKGSAWSAFQEVPTEDWFALPTDVNGLEFVPLDSAGSPVSVTAGMVFGLIFSDTGTVNGLTCSSDQIPNDGSVDAAVQIGTGTDFFGDGLSNVFVRDGSGGVLVYSLDSTDVLKNYKTLTYSGGDPYTVPVGTIVTATGSNALGLGGADLFLQQNNGLKRVAEVDDTGNVLGYVLHISSGQLSSGESVGSGGKIVVDAGGTAEATTILGGGLEVVSSGGAVAGATIKGGTLSVESDALVGNGPFTFSGEGILEFAGGEVPNNTLNGFMPGDSVDLTNIAYHADWRVSLADGLLQVSMGSTTYALHLNPYQDFRSDTFVLTADGHTGTTITMTGPSSVAAYAGNAADYSVVINADDSVTVSDIRPSTPDLSSTLGS